MDQSGEGHLTLRIKSKSIQSKVVRGIDQNQSMTTFLDLISEITGIPSSNVVLLSGFPPKRLTIDRKSTLKSLGLLNQDSVLVESGPSNVNNDKPNGSLTPNSSSDSMLTNSKCDVSNSSIEVQPRTSELELSSLPSSQSDSSIEISQPPPPPVTPETNTHKENKCILEALNSGVKRAFGDESPSTVPDSPTSRSNAKNSRPNDSRVGSNVSPNYSEHLSSVFPRQGIIMRHVVPSDNSCLFSSVAYCIMNGETRSSVSMREIIANAVRSRPDEYNEAILGRPNHDYVNWILKEDSWGGGIELSILSNYYDIEIAVVDIQSLHVSRFGEDRNFSRRIILLYDGVHYDPLFMDLMDESPPQRIFAVSDDSVLDSAMELAREAKTSHQFTDVSNFSLKCNDCSLFLTGQKEAQSHADKTGHFNFVEVQRH